MVILVILPLFIILEQALTTTSVLMKFGWSILALLIVGFAVLFLE